MWQIISIKTTHTASPHNHIINLSHANIEKNQSGKALIDLDYSGFITFLIKASNSGNEVSLGLPGAHASAAASLAN